MQHPIGNILIWKSSSISLKTRSQRELFALFMEDDEIYYYIVDDFENVIDLNAIVDNRTFAEEVYAKMRPELKNKLQEYINGIK